MKKLSFILLVTFSLFLSACGMNKEVPYGIQPFHFTDQNGQSFGVDDLKGNIWVANFIFTNCETVCPPMTSSMAELRKEIEKEGLSVQFVSFSVDPIVDQPDTLKTYLKKFTTDESNWHMLTGYTQKEIETFALEEFQTLVQKPTSSNQVIHSTSFYLIDKNGNVENNYGFQEQHFKDIIKDIKKID
jgi:protein SCO1